MPSDSRMASLLHTRQRVLLQVTPLSKRNPWVTVRPSELSCGSMWREVMALSTTAAPARAFSFTKFPLPKIRGYGVQMLWTPRKNMRRSTSPDPMTLPVSYSRTVSCHLQPRVWSWEWQLVTDDPASWWPWWSPCKLNHQSNAFSQIDLRYRYVLETRCIINHLSLQVRGYVPAL